MKKTSAQPWDTLNSKIKSCELCPRLREHCLKIAQERRKAFQDQEYWGKPIANFGDSKARLLIVGLAPAAHGANRTGQMFTGDRSGEWLYRALHKAGFANMPNAATREDGLQLKDCAITAVAHCAPPDNKPTLEEVANCRNFLKETFRILPIKVFLALGNIAWVALLKELKESQMIEGPMPKFGHGVEVKLKDGRVLLGSYHPSQQNTFTGRLTEKMLDSVFLKARRILEKDPTRASKKPLAR
jgi:uracil-DNA glycosylase family 4